MSFALITGASKGIGLSIARELASRRINLLLVARHEDALRQITSELRGKYDIEVYYFIADLSQEQSAEAVHNWCSINNYSVQYLVNNAGYGLSGKFEAHPLPDHLRLMHVNMNAVVQLCYLFLPILRRQEKAYILNIASSAAYQAVPYMGVYAATKAFVLQFSRALRYELLHSPVSVTCISPGATESNFNVTAQIGPKGVKAAQKLQMKAEDVAKIAVESMYKGKTEVITGFVNKLGAFFVWLLPKGSLKKPLRGFTNSFCVFHSPFPYICTP